MNRLAVIVLVCFSIGCVKKSEQQRRLDFCCSQGAAATLLSGIAILVPNVVTPNGDGINDTLIINGWDYYTQMDLTLRDSDSTVVFQDTNYNNTWIPSSIEEGTYSFELYADGQEVNGYICIYKDIDGCNNDCILTSFNTHDPEIACPK